MVFLMVPVLPSATYAADLPARGVINTIPGVESLTLNFTEAAKFGAVTGSNAKASPAAPGPIEDASFFVDSTLPATGWITLDADGDGQTWVYGVSYADAIGGGTFKSLSGSDSECLLSASWDPTNGNPLNPDNWVVSPAITVPANKQLQFFVCGQDPDYCAEHYGVYISTTSQTDTSTFTKLMEATVDSGEYTGVAVDLTAYAGQQVYIAFRHFNVTDEFFLNLDGVGLANAGDDPVPPFVPPTIIRIKGSNRYATSIELATNLLDFAGISQFSNAIIATGDDFPDALAGSSLSAAAAAPILLVSAKAPSSIDAALEFIEDYVDPEGVVFILGGKGAVPEDVEAKLAELGYIDPSEASEGDGIAYRFAGKGRYDTNLQVLAFLAQVTSIGEVLVCDGTNWPDAATASAIGLPIMLVAKNGFNEDQMSFINYITDYDPETETVGNSVYFDVIGGTGAVSDDIYQVCDFYDADPDGAWRLAGSDRAGTAVAVAEAFLGSPQYVAFSYGANFPDCIAGGLLAWAFDMPILYGDGKVMTPYLKADVPYLAKLDVEYAFVFGGASLVSDEFIITAFEQANAYTS